MAQAKATPSLADSLNRRAPEPSQEYITTLGLNRLTGLVNDPYRVGNMPASHMACAFSRSNGQLTMARREGWIPFEADQVTKNEYDTSKAFIADYDVDNGFVVVGFGDQAMVMCYANKSLIESKRGARKDRWRAQLDAQLGGREEARVAPRKDADKDYRGGFTSDMGYQANIGYAESSQAINPDNPTDDLFRSVEGE